MLRRTTINSISRNILRHPQPSYARNLSSLARRQVTLRSSLNCVRVACSQPQLLSIAPTTLGLRRHNSTASTGNATTAATQQPALEVLPDGDVASSANSWFEQLTSTSTELITPHAGYLHEAGLDFGWGPTSVIQWLVENVHLRADTPWWATLTISTIIVRALILYPSIRMTDNMAKMASLRPKIDKINEKYNEEKKSSIQAAQQEKLKRMSLLRSESGISTSAFFAPLVLQSMAGIGVFRFIRHLSQVDGLGLDQGGVLWFMDLAIPDQLYAIPLMTGAMMHIVARFGGEAAAGPAANPVIRSLTFYVIPVGFSTFLAFQPAALQLCMALATTWMMAQGWLFRRPRVRNMLGISPLPQPTIPNANQQLTFSSMMDSLKENYAKFQEEAELKKTQRLKREFSSPPVNRRTTRSKLEEERAVQSRRAALYRSRN